MLPRRCLVRSRVMCTGVGPPCEAEDVELERHTSRSPCWCGSTRLVSVKVLDLLDPHGVGRAQHHHPKCPIMVGIGQFEKGTPLWDRLLGARRGLPGVSILSPRKIYDLPPPEMAASRSRAALPGVCAQGGSPPGCTRRDSSTSVIARVQPGGNGWSPR